MFIERNFTDRATFSNYDVYPPFHSVHFKAGVVFLQTNTKNQKQNSSKDLDEIQSSGKNTVVPCKIHRKRLMSQDMSRASIEWDDPSLNGMIIKIKHQYLYYWCLSCTVSSHCMDDEGSIILHVETVQIQLFHPAGPHIGQQAVLYGFSFPFHWGSTVQKM